MSISTDQLREALHAYADDVALPDPAALVAGAGHKRSHERKVRTAVIAGAAAVLMAVVTVIGLQGIGHEKALTPAQLNKKHHTHFAEYTRGLKLTSIVEVPVKKVADADSAPNTVPGAVDVTLPSTGSAIYLVCNSRYTTRAGANDPYSYSQSIDLRSGPNSLASCNPGMDVMLGAARPGAREHLWLLTTAQPRRTTSPVAIYTQVGWPGYPGDSARLSPQPQPLNPKDTPNGEHNVVFSGTGSTSATKTITVPASMTRGAQLSVVPSTPGRFQVVVNGTLERLDYNGLPAKLGGPFGWGVAGFAPEVRGRWLDFWPDTGDGIINAAPGSIEGPEPGQSATITIRAVDTTGPWQVMLTWHPK